LRVFAFLEFIMSESREYEITQKVVAQRQQASRSHGIFAFRKRGEDALNPSQVDRLADLRALLQNEPGRTELRCELTARMAMICHLGFVHLERQAEAGNEIWEGGVIHRLATYVSETRRLLDSFDQDVLENTAADIIRQTLDDDD
jgi:hypothetical protein